jgi:TonB-dependent Receptor Plug Domain
MIIPKHFWPLVIRGTTVWLLAGLSAPLIRAQVPNPSPSPNDTKLEQVVVTGAQIPLNEAIVPTVRPTSAAYGLDQNVMDVPRNITIISRAQLDDVDVTDPQDFTKLTSSSYTTSNFGNASNPAIRGQLADVFVNGIRQPFVVSGAGMPIDFNAVDSVDIFKGPPSVEYGVSSYVGGFVNLETKQPFFDGYHGDVSTTIGTDEQYRWSFDFGGPIIPEKLAFRISYSEEESGSYYENAVTDTQSIYGALTWTPTSQYTLSLNGDLRWATFTENLGINRPTQNLINNNQYFSGYILGWNGVGADYGKYVQSADNIIVPTGTVDLSHSIRLLNPGSLAVGEDFRGQAVQTLILNDDAKIINNTAFEYNKWGKAPDYYFEYDVDPAVNFENRTELQLNYDYNLGPDGSVVVGGGKDGKSPITEEKKPFVISTQINLGLDVQYREETSYTDYFSEPVNSWDLALSRAYIHYVNFGITDIPVPGHPGWYATPGVLNNSTNSTRYFDIAPFYEQVINLGDHLSVQGGVRADIIDVTVMDPLFDQAEARGLVTGNNNKGSAVVIDPNANISVVYKPWKWLRTYFTYNYSQSTADANGGGIPSEIPIPVSQNLHQVSQLFEAGAKASLLQDTLYLSSAVFQQNRNILDITGANEDDIVRGIEFEADYQPSRNFYFSLGYSYLDSHIHGSPFVSQFYPVDSPQQRLPNGDVMVDNGGYLPNGSYRQPGLPDNLFNFLVKYQVPTNYGTFGAILSTTVTSPWTLSYTGLIVVPWQYNMDFTLFYRTKDNRWEARLAFLNLTDQQNWSPSPPSYGYSSVIADWPFHLQATISYKF